jgi:hypothetical protein
MFLDESGDHNLSKIDAQFPVFVLGGVIADADYAADHMDKAVREFKRQTFGRFEIGDCERGGRILVEKRGSVFDSQLHLAWHALNVSGTTYLPGHVIRWRIAGLTVVDKHENVAGLQLTDLVVSPIGRYVLGNRAHEDFGIVESKFRRDREGHHDGYGLVVLPKE